MTLVAFFEYPDGGRGLAEVTVPTMTAAMEAGIIYSAEPGFIGTTIIPDDNLDTFDPEHVFDILRQANAEA